MDANWWTGLLRNQVSSVRAYRSYKCGKLCSQRGSSNTVSHVMSHASHVMPHASHVMSHASHVMGGMVGWDGACIMYVSLKMVISQSVRPNSYNRGQLQVMYVYGMVTASSSVEDMAHS